MSNKETDDANESQPAGGPSDETTTEQAEDGGLLSNITGYFSSDNSDETTTDDSGGSEPGSGDEPAADPFADDPADEMDSEPDPDPFADDPNTGVDSEPDPFAGDSADEMDSEPDPDPFADDSADETDSGPDPDPFADDSADETDSEPDPFAGNQTAGSDTPASDDTIEGIAGETTAQEADETFSDLLGPEEDEERTQASERDGSAGSDEDPMAGESMAEEPMTDEIPDPREESSADIDPVAGESGDEDVLETDDDADPFEEMEGAFEEMDVDDVQPDDVWTDVADAEQQSVSTGAERTYAEVAKSEFCETCEHFSKPPEAHCNHEGTEIVEFTDMKNIRVVDCPVVAERRGLEEGMHGALGSGEDESEALGIEEAGELEGE